MLMCLTMKGQAEGFRQCRSGCGGLVVDVGGLFADVVAHQDPVTPFGWLAVHGGPVVIGLQLRVVGRTR